MAGGKKITREERERLKAVEAERKLLEAEEERRQAEEVEAVRRAEREEAARLAAEADRLRRRLRGEQLRETKTLTEEYETSMKETKLRLLEQEEWNRLMRCDGLPDPLNVPELTRYLALWRGGGGEGQGEGVGEGTEGTTTLDSCMECTTEMIAVINDLETVMENAENPTEKQQRYWREIWLELQVAQREKLDQATYTQLLDLRPHLDHDTMVYSFFKGSPLVSLALWSNTTRSLKNASHKVEELGFSFTLPESLLEMECVVRVMRTGYDHYSKFTHTFSTPKVAPPTVSLLDMAEASLAAMEASNLTSAEDPSQFNPSKDETNDKEGDDEVDLNPPTTPMPEISPGELNLRRQRVQGGVWTVDLLALPPQPRILGPHCTVKQVEEECTVSPVPWVSDYRPPAAPQAGGKRKTPQDVEHETRQREQELQKLVLVAVKLPDSAFWYEPPHMVLWDPDKQLWTNECFHDVKYKEEQSLLQVRTSRLGVMGLAMNRFSNLPFQNWELQPSPDGQDMAELMLVGAVVVATFTIGEGFVRVKQLKDGSRSVLTQLYQEDMKPSELMLKLQQYGITLFPDVDSFCYMDGLPQKERATEAHTYHCMARMATATAFSWSRWNLLAGHKNIVFQMKFVEQNEVRRGSDDAQPLVLVTPERATITECTELSQSFSPQPQNDDKFFADLFHLGVGEGGPPLEEGMRTMSPLLVHTISSLLARASVLSYC